MASQQVNLYGIPNCDTVKKSRAWLTEHGVAVRFFDFKKTGVPCGPLRRWLAAVGHDVLVNRRGRTWRQLSDEERTRAADTAGAEALLTAHPSLIRRPVIEWGDAPSQVTVGYVPEEWLARLRPPRR